MSFSGWAQKLESLEVPADAAGLTEALVFHDRYTAKLALAVAEFDTCGLWEIDGSTTVIAWLKDRGMTRNDAMSLARIGEKARRLPVLAAAWVDGTISGGHVRAISAQLVERHMELFTEHEAELVPAFARLTVDETIRAMAAWRAKADALVDGPEPGSPVRDAHLSETIDGRGHLSASLDAEGTALAAAALRLADSADFEVAASRRRGDALIDIFRFFLDHQQSKIGGRHRPHLNIVVKAETIGTDHVEGEVAETGMLLDSPTLNRLLCDCNLHRVLVDSAGTILDYGRSTRTPPVNLFNALVVRDRHCRFPGCDRPPSWCDAHHVKWWRNKGETSLKNLVLLCSKHHHKIHLKGWRTQLGFSGDFEVVTPWGYSRTTWPPGREPEPELTWLDKFNADPDGAIWRTDTELVRQRVRALVRNNAA